MTVRWTVTLRCVACSARITYRDEVPPWQGPPSERFVECVACGGRAYPRRSSTPRSSQNARHQPNDPEAELLAQLSPHQRAAVLEIHQSSELSEVEKMWGITEAVLGGASAESA